MSHLLTILNVSTNKAVAQTLPTGYDYHWDARDITTLFQEPFPLANHVTSNNDPCASWYDLEAGLEFAGDAGEVVVYPNAQNNSEVDAVSDYLLARWAA